jgi:hypothetical protein
MKYSNGRRAEATVTALLLSLIPGISAAASIDCEAVLRDGVFDEHQIRRLDDRIDQARSAICGRTESSQSFDVEIVSGLTDNDLEMLCAASADDLVESDGESLERANRLIVNAFNECAIRNEGGVSHGIFTTEDPAVFTYHVQFTPDSAIGDRVSVDSFEIHNANCRPPLDRETEIVEGRRTLICTRDPADMVIVGLNTVGNEGTRYLEPLRLNAYTETESPVAIGAVGTVGIASAEQTGPSEPTEPSVTQEPVTTSVTRPYRRFGARRQMIESSCDGPAVELKFEETTQVKLIGKAVAQGRGSPYPLWIKVKTGDEIHCERQAWPSGRGSVTAVCMVWIEANRSLSVEAEQGGEYSNCVNTELEVWY